MSTLKLTESDDYLLEQEEKKLSAQYILDEAAPAISMETHIPENNIGYRLLQKMGWTAGKGLGSRGQGRIDPIRIELKDDSLGIGKAEEYQSTHIITTAKRKALDSEKQLEETDAQKMERQFQVEKKQAIAKELEQVKRAFYCELCDKQYKQISEYEQHLQSYDHHHKKRFKDMKESTRNSSLNQSMREKKLAREKKREERELKRIQEAIHKKTDTTLPKKPIVPISAPKCSNGNGGGGGWTNEIVTATTTSSSSGWTKATAIDNSGGWTAAADSVPPKPSEPKPSMPIVPEPKPAMTIIPETKASMPIASEPKKLSFGLKKKTTSFQFGLKKK